MSAIPLVSAVTKPLAPGVAGCLAGRRRRASRPTCDTRAVQDGSAAPGPAGAFDENTKAATRRELFNGISSRYDVLNDALSLGQHRVWKRAAVQWARPPAGGAALDVCTGSGDMAFELARAVGPDGDVTALDFAPGLLARARGRDEAASPAAARRRAPIAWVEGDAMALPFPAASFDAATMGYGLRNVASPACALAELRRVLRPGARAAVLDFNNPREAPVVDAIQSLALDRVVVPVATASGLRDEYAYLRPSIEAFATARRVARLGRG